MASPRLHLPESPLARNFCRTLQWSVRESNQSSECLRDRQRWCAM